MKCNECGFDILDGKKFCTNCGSPVEVMEEDIKEKDFEEESIEQDFEEQVMEEQLIEEKVIEQDVTKAGNEKFNSLLKGEDNIYRWVYSLNMWTNPTIIITLLKTLAIALIGPIIFTGLIFYNKSFDEAKITFMAMAVPAIIIIVVLCIITYILVAIRGGGKYCVVFELDSKGIKHIQMQKEFNKQQVLELIRSLSQGNPGTIATGLLSGSKRSYYTQFSKVKSIVGKKSRSLIYLNEGFERNQVYAPKEDFENVLDYIMRHSKKAKVKVK